MTRPTKKLGEVLELCDAGTWGDKAVANGMPLLRSTNIQDGRLVLDDLAIIDVPEDKRNRYTLQEGDILITKSSGSETHIGKALYIDAELDGKYGFSNFMQRLRINKSLAYPRWIYHIVSNPETRRFILEASRTTSGLRNLNTNTLKELKIPLPPIEEQKRIVAKIGKLFAKIDEAKRLRAEALSASAALLPSALHQIFSSAEKEGWKMRGIGEVAILNPKKAEVKELPDNLEVSFVPMAAVYENTQSIIDPETRKLGAVRKGYTYFKEGDVLFAKITPCMENGKVAIAKNLKNGIGFGSTEFHVIRATGKILPEWIFIIVGDPSFREEAERYMTGTAGQQRVPIDFLRNVKIPLPSIAEQKKIVAYLDSLSQKVRVLHQTQAETAEDLNTLTQSILHRAFTGMA